MNLTRKKRLLRIEKGKYLLVPFRAGTQRYWAEEPWVIVPHLIDAYYIGFWTAMNYWGMTEQIPRTIFVVTTKKKDDFEFENQKFKFVKLSNKKFFGYVKEKRGNTEFNISSKEKTIIDGLMHPEYCGGISEVAKAMWNIKDDVDWKTVLRMAKEVEVNIVLRRLGYLLSILDIQKNLVLSIKKELFKGYLFLGPAASKERFGYSKEFGLILNEKPTALTDWMGY